MVHNLFADVAPPPSAQLPPPLPLFVVAARRGLNDSLYYNVLPLRTGSVHYTVRGTRDIDVVITEKSEVGRGFLVVLEDGVPVPYYIEEKDWKNAVPEIGKSALLELPPSTGESVHGECILERIANRLQFWKTNRGVDFPYYLEEKDWKNAVPEIDKSAFGKLQEALISPQLIDVHDGSSSLDGNENQSRLQQLEKLSPLEDAPTFVIGKTPWKFCFWRPANSQILEPQSMPRTHQTSTVVRTPSMRRYSQNRHPRKNNAKEGTNRYQTTPALNAEALPFLPARKRNVW
eukprot:CAMPEP_0113857224 /NCGR_PEP_ID=MMETSP0372-20130328/9971_1 /TAXON_ID=340204 /ORGANISM="Lankesteria abbotti" /LENGTH=288 /DNA_ID=CAMNT_0000832909 /DNA_START=304 /DNA_END=1167 /DNA_ORIENTATION=+ /assembly_acc=CAM_ASM_000359